MPNEDKIQEIQETLQKVLGQFDNMRLQLGIFESRFKSELGRDGTFDRLHDGFNKEIARLNDLIYNRDTGLAFEIDRLIQQDKKREQQSKWMWWLAGGVVLSVFKTVWDFITKK